MKRIKHRTKMRRRMINHMISNRPYIVRVWVDGIGFMFLVRRVKGRYLNR